MKENDADDGCVDSCLGALLEAGVIITHFWLLCRICAAVEALAGK